MDKIIIWIFSSIGVLTLFGVFIRMKKGFGHFNLRIVGLVLISTFISILAVYSEDLQTAAIGLLGTIAGYLFGNKNEKDNSNYGN